jgi:cytoskeletal protein RodZ
VITGAHSRIDPLSHRTTAPPPRHLKSKGPRRELRRGRIVTVSVVGAAALVGVIAYLASSPGAPPPKKSAVGTARHSHTSSGVSTTTPSTTSPPTSTTRPAPTSTQPAASTTAPPATSPTASTTPVTAATQLPPSDVLVEVVNGVGTPDAARQAARALHRLGFAINGVANANSFDHSRNLIEYGPGSLAAAETVAAHVTGNPQYREYRALEVNEVWVILGATYDGVTP